ncbi:MAG: VWA domain-containing protein [Alistipes sp.]|nr:VWA domain-containing protein [Alistipes sp.]
MKRHISLFIGLFLLLFSTENAFAKQQFAEKTRYVYLWDVTGSTKQGGLYERMTTFLKEDIKDKCGEGCQVVIIPFNDEVLKGEIKKYPTADDSFSEIDPLIKRGWALVEQHNIDFVAGNGKGYTNIASAVEYAKEEYIDDDYNTIFILLTDDGQEYLEDGSKKNGLTPESEAYLKKTLENMDKEMKEEDESLNRLFYIIFKRQMKYPDSTTHTKFIEGKSIKVRIKRLGLGEVNEPTPRDKSFAVKVKGLDKELLHNRNIKVDVTLESDDKEAYKGTCPLDCLNGQIVVNCDNLKEGEYKLACSLKSYDEERDNIYVGLLFEGEAEFEVEDRFKPTVTLKIK